MSGEFPNRPAPMSKEERSTLHASPMSMMHRLAAAGQAMEQQEALLASILDVLVRIEEAVQALRGAEPQSNNGASSPNNRSE